MTTSMASEQEVINTFLQNSIVNGHKRLVREAIDLGADIKSVNALSNITTFGNYHLAPVVAPHIKGVASLSLAGIVVKNISKYQSAFDDNIKSFLDILLSGDTIKDEQALLKSLHHIDGPNGAQLFIYVLRDFIHSDRHIDDEDLFFHAANSLRKFLDKLNMNDEQNHLHANKISKLLSLLLSRINIDHNFISDGEITDIIKSIVSPLFVITENSDGLSLISKHFDANVLSIGPNALSKIKPSLALQTCQEFNISNLPTLPNFNSFYNDIDYLEIRAIWGILLTHVSYDNAGLTDVITDFSVSILLACVNENFSVSEIIKNIENATSKGDVQLELMASVISDILTSATSVRKECLSRKNSIVKLVEIINHLTSVTQKIKSFDEKFLAMILVASTEGPRCQYVESVISQLTKAINNPTKLISYIENTASSEFMNCQLFDNLNLLKTGTSTLPLKNLSTYKNDLGGPITEAIHNYFNSSKPPSQLPFAVYNDNGFFRKIAALTHIRLTDEKVIMENLGRARKSELIDAGLVWLEMTPVEALRAYGDVATPAHNSYLLSKISG